MISRKPKSFQEYLNGIFEGNDCMEVERLDILRRCSSTTVFQNNKVRALLAVTFVRLCPYMYLYVCSACWDRVLSRVAMLIKHMLC